MDLFVNHCRLCRAGNIPTDDWTQLTQFGYEHLLEKIQACTGVQIRADDGLPKRICQRCEASLDQANTFRLQCREADAWWRFNFEESVSKPAPITSIYVKPEIVDEDEMNGGDDQSVGVETVLKEESVEDSDYEPAKDEQSSEESENNSSKKKKKVTPKKKGGTEFQCSECPKQFSQKGLLKKHEAVHAGIRSYECTQCDSKFYTSGGLKRHMELKHSTNRPFQCDKCDRKYVKKADLVKHQLSHSEMRPFSCELCPKAFHTQPKLNAHMRWVHQPEEIKEEKKKAYQRTCVCSYCGKISKSVTLHKKHLITHTGEKNYECQICSKRFTALWSHRKHMLIHTGERPHQCEFCQKAFRDKSHLTTHIRGVHTNERPFQCRICPKAFVTRQSMQFHEKTHGEPVVGFSV